MQWQFQSWTEFWAMGGYGFYVWLAFAVTFLAVLVLILDSVKSRKRALVQVITESDRKARIRAARQSQEASVQEVPHEP